MADFDAETSPLLSKRPTPLPKLQLSLLFFIRATDPICFNVIFPFINQMLLDVGAVDDPDKVGYKAGIIESLFSLCQLITIFHWGALSDRIGRKPVLLIGCLGSSISALAFGFSKSFVFMCLARCITGVMNGNIAVLKSAIAEITDETNEARAFSFFPVCLNLGIIISAVLGGNLANTRGSKIADLFPLFESNPYLLPMALASLFPLISGLTAYFLLKETLPPKIEIEYTDGGEPIQPASYRSLFTTHITLIIVTFAVISLFGICILALLPLFCFTAIDKGGLGFDARHIGWVISQRSVSTLVIQLVAFPWLQKRFGTIPLFKMLMMLWIPTFALLPTANMFARAGQMTMVWVTLYLFMILSALSNLGFVCNLLMTNAATPSPQLLGAINGYSQVMSSVVGFVGPAGATSLFAVSVDRGILGGDLVWLVLILIAAFGVLTSFLIRQPPRPAVSM